MLENYKRHFIPVSSSARDALKILDQLPQNEVRVLFVLDGNKMVGTLTDGDIRRGLLQDKEISEGVSLYMNKNFQRFRSGEVNPESIARYRKLDIWFLPVLNEHSEIEQVINLKNLHTVIPAAALIMAGGRGERLRPLTDTLPKPLLKVGDKPIIEINIDRLIRFGVTKFYISIKYLGEKIKEYLGDGSYKNVSIEYVCEEQPLGTIGAASLINGLDYDHLLVMNADILTNLDYEDFFNYYLSAHATMCAASFPYSVIVPYGIMNMNEDDLVSGLVEKPTYTYYANAGIYLFNKGLIKKIPKGVLYNATDLMQLLIDKNEKLIQYPILQYWLDIGKPADYTKAQEDIKHLNL